MTSERIEVLRNDITLLMRWIEWPPEECDHGFTTPRDCPNAQCIDRDTCEAWDRLEQAVKP